MRTGTAIALGIGAVAVIGVAAIAFAGAGVAGERVTKHGMVWDTGTCKILDLDGEKLAKWLNDNVRRIVHENNVTTGEGLMVAVFNAMAPEQCQGLYPPEEGSALWDEWELLLKAYGHVFQNIVDQILAEGEGTRAAWGFDPGAAAANALALILE